MNLHGPFVRGGQKLAESQLAQQQFVCIRLAWSMCDVLHQHNIANTLLPLGS